MKRFLNLLCAGCLLPAAMGAPSPITLTVHPRPDGYAIPEDFAGLSFETWAEGPNRSGVSGYLFSPTNETLITLFTNSDIRNLRLGGCTADGLHAMVPSRADIDSAFGFARVASVKVIYALRLLNGDTAENAATAKYIWSHYRSLLVGFAIGNEPDVPSYRYPPFGTGTDPGITNYSSYLAAWKQFAAAITAAVPDARFVGPDAASISEGWTARFVKDVVGSGSLILATQHGYIGGKPFINGGRKDMPAQVAIDHMLSRNWVTNKYPSYYSNTVALVAAAGLPFRMTEVNDYLHGVTNASNAFASTLWALDYLHWWAAHGCAGLNFHNNQHKEWLRTDTIYLDEPSGEFRIYPKAYAFKAFGLGSHGRTQPVVIEDASELNLTAYAVGDANHLCITLINKEHGDQARDAAVTITANGLAPENAAVMFLSTSNGYAGATNGITLGGARITNHGPWRGRWTALPPSVDHSCKVIVPATSAALVKLSTAHR
jgi:hypothetical protein